MWQKFTQKKRAFKDTPLLIVMYLHTRAIKLLYKHNITLVDMSYGCISTRYDYLTRLITDHNDPVRVSLQLIHQFWLKTSQEQIFLELECAAQALSNETKLCLHIAFFCIKFYSLHFALSDICFYIACQHLVFPLF